MRWLTIIPLALFGLSALLGGHQTMPARMGEGVELLRYSGYDGVEFEYPETWKRLQVNLLWQRPSGTPPPTSAMPPIFGIGRDDAQGARVGAFTYMSYALELLPEALWETEAFASATVAELRQEDPQSIIKGVTPLMLAGRDALEFSVIRPRAKGGDAVVHSWVITWRHRHFVFSVTTIGTDDQTRELVMQEGRQIMATLKLRTEPRQPDGTFARFADGTGLSFRYPSHWHDLPATDPWICTWSHIDAQGQEKAVVRFMAGRFQGGDEPPEVLDRMALMLDPAMGAQQVLSQGPIAGGGFEGLQRMIRVHPNGQPKNVYLLALKKGESYFGLIGIVAKDDSARFEQELDGIASSLSVRQ